MAGHGRTAALVPAAGRGERLGPGTPKALRLLGGQPLLVHAVHALSDVPCVELVVVAAPAEQVEEVHCWIRDWLKERFGATVGETLRIQYGGSVKPENAAQLLRVKNVDGALVGGASLKADSFVAIVKAAL